MELSFYKQTFYNNINMNKKIVVQNHCSDLETHAEIIHQAEIGFIPKISIIIPVYNNALYLKPCLDSVIGQTLTELEIICVDDESTDNSMNILKEYAHADCRFTIIKQPKLTAGAARNAGLAVAKGEYVHFLDSDDWIDLNFYETLYARAKETDADLVRTTFTYEYENKSTHSEFNTIAIDNFRFRHDLRINDHSVVIWNAIYRLDFIKENNVYFQNVKHSNDILFTTRATFLSKKSVPCIGTNYHYRKQVDSQLSVLTKERIFTVLDVNSNVINNINLIAEHKSDEHYIALYRCFTRYKNLLLDGFNDELISLDECKEIFLNIIKDYNSCNLDSHFIIRCKELYNYDFDELYINSIVNNDFDAFFAARIDKEMQTKNNINAFDNVKNILSKVQCYFRSNTTNIDKTEAENIDLIVSLTSYPARINTIHQTITTLLTQSLRPNAVILWLAPEEFPNKEKDLPPQLLELQERGLTIDWYKNIKSYKKLIPALKKYPDSVIITVDDDALYHKDFLKALYTSYITHPHMIHGTRCHKIQLKRSTLLPYNEWILKIKNCEPAYSNFFTGLGGVLYPAHCFHPDILHEDAFMHLAPQGDDIWFWAMAVLQGKKVHVVNYPEGEIQLIDGSQDCALWKDNVLNCINDKQLAAVFAAYPKLRIILLTEKAKVKLVNLFCSIKKMPLRMLHYFKRTHVKNDIAFLSAQMNNIQKNQSIIIERLHAIQLHQDRVINKSDNIEVLDVKSENDGIDKS